MASKKPVFLDVDTNIIEKNLLLEECKSNLDDYKAILGLNTDGEAPWKLVTPTPGFCVKTVDDKGKKTFVNICTIDDIPEPKDITEEQLLEIIENEDISDFRMPLSLQEPREELDKSGNPAMVYDVAIHPKFLDKVLKSLAFKTFLLQVTFDGLKDKYDVDLDIENYRILKERKSIGVLKPHRIRTTSKEYKPPKKLVQELATPVGQPINVLSTTVPSTQIPYRFVRTEKDGRNYLYGEIHLPNLVRSKDVSLEIGQDRIFVECRRANHLLDLFFPLKLNQEGASAEINISSKLLHIFVPIEAL